MHFCSICDNVLHMQIGALEDKKKTTDTATVPLLMYCKHCPFTLEFDQNKDNNPRTQVFNPCMYRSNYSSNHPLYFSTLVNKYTFDDPTLPRMHCACPNDECLTHKDNQLTPEVIFVRFDDQEMQYLYLCQHCRQCWYKNTKDENVVLFDFAENTPASSDIPVAAQ